MAKKSTSKSKTSKQRRGGPASQLATIIGAIIIGIAALIGAIGGGLVETEPATSTPPATSAITGTPIAAAPGSVQTLSLTQGFGAQKGFWQVYFTAPTDSSASVGGIAAPLVDAINSVQSTLDIAAYEWNVPAITQAVINAHNRGVQVRMVVDREASLQDEESTIREAIDAGIPVVDDGRSGLMHNKFMIMDSTVVWTGSMNYTINDIYRNNNNVLVLRSRRAIEAYQAEFNEMFVQKEFGSSRSARNSASFNQDGTPVQIYFAPEDSVVPNMLQVINNARSSVRFMTFSFTLDEIGGALKSRAARGVDVRGIFEVRGSRTQFSELPGLFCAGLEIREDGNPFTFHHKVFIVDDDIVMTGSFNISESATNNNDENLVIIQDRDLAAQYIAEFERVWAQSATPPRDQITCP